jgi:hypothetical protein
VETPFIGDDMTSIITITAHPAHSKNGIPLVVDVLELDGDECIKQTYLKDGDTYRCSVWEGRSVFIGEVEGDL